MRPQIDQGPRRRPIRPYGQQVIPPYRPPVCPGCGSRRIKGFTQIYSRGTTYYTRIKGLILKHGYERTRKQSVLANRCSPPIKLSWLPAVLLAFLTLFLYWVIGKMENVSLKFQYDAYYLGWIALITAILTGVYNFFVYPGRMAKWSRTFICEECNLVFMREL